jgi:excisionase family DNA binding protein
MPLLSKPMVSASRHHYLDTAYPARVAHPIQESNMERQQSESPAAKAGQLLTVNEAAELLSLSPKTLNKDRCVKSMNVPFVRLGRAIRYRRCDLEKFIADCVVTAQ